MLVGAWFAAWTRDLLAWATEPLTLSTRSTKVEEDDRILALGLGICSAVLAELSFWKESADGTSGKELSETRPRRLTGVTSAGVAGRGESSSFWALTEPFMFSSFSGGISLVEVSLDFDPLPGVTGTFKLTTLSLALNSGGGGASTVYIGLLSGLPLDLGKGLEFEGGDETEGVEGSF